MPTFEKRLKEALELREMSQTELSKKTGISKAALSQYMKGLYRAKQDRVELLANALNVSEAWLMGYDVPITKGLEIIPIPDILTQKIPLIGATAAGLPIEAINENDYVEIGSEINCDCALRVKGDSMIDAGIYNNDIALIKLQGNLDNGQIGVIIIDGEVTLKKYYRRDDVAILRPCNEKYEDLIFHLNEIESFRIYGKCVGIIRKI